jgi:chromosome partitioning protein
MSKIIAIANQKGGVGKTTTCINLAASLAATHRNVLLIDLDPQGNATMGSGIDKNSTDFTTCDLLLGDVSLANLVVKNDDVEYDILPGNGDLTAAEVALMDMPNRERQLRNALADVHDHYDYILIDCPPSLNMLTLNALVAANSVMIPMQCEYYALEGLSALMETVESIRSTVNPELQIEGLLRTMYDPRNNLANDVSGQLLLHFPKKVYRTIIPRNVRLAEAPSHGIPVINYDKSSRGALAYLALAGEILRNDENATLIGASA